MMVQTFAKGDTLTAYHASITGQAGSGFRAYLDPREPYLFKDIYIYIYIYKESMVKIPKKVGFYRVQGLGFRATARNPLLARSPLGLYLNPPEPPFFVRVPANITY